MSKRSQHHSVPASTIGLPSNIRLTVEPERLEVVYASRNWIGGLWPLAFGSAWTAAVVYGTVTEIHNGAT